MARKCKPIPIEEISEYLEYDETSETGLRWKRAKRRAKVKVGDEAGTFNKSNGYYVLKFNQNLYGAHRVVYALYHNEDPGELEIDHINRIKTDNRIENLRLANRSLQMFNRKGFGKSKYKGVTHQEGNKKPWIAQIVLNKENKNLGSFDTEIAAALVSSAAHIGRDGYYLWPTE